MTGLGSGGVPVEIHRERPRRTVTPAPARGLRVSRWVMPLVAVLVLFGTYGVTKASGAWISSGRTLLEHGEAIAPAHLRGWMTLQQVSDGTGIPVRELTTLIGAPAGVVVTPQTPLNELEDAVPGFEVDTLREKLLARQASGGTTASSAPSVSPTALPSPSAGHTPTGTGTGTGTGGTITGQQTLTQVADAAGIPVERLIEAAKLPADVPRDVPMRDLRDRIDGFGVSTVRDAVAALGR